MKSHRLKFFRQYFIFAALLVIASVFAFQAGEIGLKKSTSSQKLFRSFPVLNENKDSSLYENVKAKDQSVEVQENKEKGFSQKEEEKETKKSSPEKHIKNNEKESRSLPSLSSSGALRSDPSGASVYILKTQETKERGLPQRKKILPSFSDIYVPVYGASQLAEPAWYGFRAAFPFENPEAKLFVLEKVISSPYGTRYEVRVYEKDGLEFRGTFETLEGSPTQADFFPFHGVPAFKRIGTSQFEHTSRFFVLNEEGALVLSNEAHLQSLFKTAYQTSLDPHTLLGKDENFNVHIYKLFPGIFLAEPLR